MKRAYLMVGAIISSFYFCVIEGLSTDVRGWYLNVFFVERCGLIGCVSMGLYRC